MLNGLYILVDLMESTFRFMCRAVAFGAESSSGRCTMLNV
jgi:hypothetical protein